MIIYFTDRKINILGMASTSLPNGLRIYNDLCDTEELDISTNSKGSKSKYNDITKPYYDLGNFNFNYLRDKNTKSRIYGNYFIVEFIFEADNINDIEFESLNYSITKRVI